MIKNAWFFHGMIKRGVNFWFPKSSHTRKEPPPNLSFIKGGDSRFSKLKFGLQLERRSPNFSLDKMVHFFLEIILKDLCVPTYSKLTGKETPNVVLPGTLSTVILP